MSIHDTYIKIHVYHKCLRYGHRDLAAEEHLVADQLEPGAEIIIQHPEERFARRNARISRRLELAGAMEMEEEQPDGDADGKLHVD